MMMTIGMLLTQEGESFQIRRQSGDLWSWSQYLARRPAFNFIFIFIHIDSQKLQSLLTCKKKIMQIEIVILIF